MRQRWPSKTPGLFGLRTKVASSKGQVGHGQVQAISVDFTPTRPLSISDSFEIITAHDLPIQLDDPAALKKPTGYRNPLKELTARFHRKRKSILDEFPQPPSYIPSTAERQTGLRSTFSLHSPQVSEADKHRVKSAANSIVHAFKQPQQQEPQLELKSPVPTFELVPISRLKASPVASHQHLVPDLFPSSARSSFVPPSPSWLSRNVSSPPPDSDTASEETLLDYSPAPLPIPLRVHIPTPAASPQLSILDLDSSHQEDFLATFRSDFDTTQQDKGLLDTSAAYIARTGSTPSQKPLGLSATPSFQSFVSHVSFQAYISSYTIHSNPSVTKISSNMDFTGKRTDVVDFGGEFDYSGQQWFQDPPPRPEPSAPSSVQTPYVPLPDDIEQNNVFEYALRAAPNVLYARYKQYGQLGVLAWCSEFGELIDGLKDLGFQGNMFVQTRTQALGSCEEILKLKLDIKMQIIVMYLSSQISRLRRFLDPEQQWDDYPMPEFPIEPMTYLQQ